jgi:NAD(P)-dependent dehydrogenase (short-subunit alcohol dehydrogenase family)
MDTTRRTAASHARSLRLGRGRRADLEGSTALITGGSRGLGLALAHELVQQGARVALLARSEAALCAARAQIRTSLGHEVEVAVCDLRDPAQIELAIARLLALWGRIDILINNAGIIQLGPAEHKLLGEYENAMAVHFWAPLHTMRAVIPSMKQHGGGRIVNVSSIEGKVAFPHMAPYCASKFALTGLSDALRAELARERIHITTVWPGLIRTGSPSAASEQHAPAPGWTSLAAAPLVSMSAEHAARLIVRACRDGRRSLELGLLAKLLIRADAIAPDTLGALMELVNRLLPSRARGAQGPPGSARAARPAGG